MIWRPAGYYFYMTDVCSVTAGIHMFSGPTIGHDVNTTVPMKEKITAYVTLNACETLKFEQNVN